MSPSKAVQKPRVLSIGYPAYVGEDYLEDFKNDFDFEVLESPNRKRVQTELPAQIASRGKYDALIIRMGTHPYEPFDKNLLGALVPGVSIIASASAGYNEFDVDWMTKNKIWFCNTRNAVSEATADMTIFLLLAVLKDATNAEKSAREGKWRADHVPTRDPSGLTLGIIGMGNIGKHVARKASAFNLKVQYHNRTRLSPSEESTYTYCSTLPTLLSTSDIISIHCPLNPTTKSLLSYPEFSTMKQNTYLINTARGPIVDEAALIAALESGKITRAGLDVFDGEPRINEYFRRSGRCVLQPHLGGLTDGAFRKAERECFKNVRGWFLRGRPVAPVNEVV
ncbi:MAG: hypothetical protein M1834_000860 [Cirrosporium novae-zelandiae]|nr:MAG: hypothetical protein M1834_000860 [Cirrosporium novae-zelandiae]